MNHVLPALTHSPAAPSCSHRSAPRSRGTTSRQAWGLFHPHHQQHKCLHLRSSPWDAVPVQRGRYIPKPSLAGCLQRRARLTRMRDQPGWVRRNNAHFWNLFSLQEGSTERQGSPALCVTPPQGPQNQPFVFAVQRAAGQLRAWLPTELLEQITLVLARDSDSSGSFSAEKQFGRFDSAGRNGA